MKPFNKLVIASFKQFFRDRTALFFTFAFPLLFMIIFGLVFSGDNDNVNYDIGLANQDESVIGTTFSESLQMVPIFEVSEGVLDDKLAELKEGDIQAVVQIPANVQSAINSGNVAEIIVYYDPAQTTSSQVILSVLDQIVNEANYILTQQPAVIKLSEQSIQVNILR
ncbi:MAG: ABC transporter permease, partial [Dehalococcoidales bacterium]|nr:ABC transporter permease [Dehalococcoidales bacterium]